MNSQLQHRIQPQDQLCFIHIPKTAGTTLIAILDAHFPLDRICPEPANLKAILPELQQPNAELTPEILSRYQLIRGHFEYAKIDRLLKKPLYLTMLRNPIDRVISLFEFFRRAKARNEPEYQPDTKLLRDATDNGIEAFVLNPNPIIKARSSNRQIRILATDPELADSDTDLLAQAKANLEKFIFVGITEQFQESVLLLSYIFGWRPATSVQSLRVAEKQISRETLSQAAIDVIYQCNQLDFELYEFAQKLLHDRFAQMQAELQQKYDQSVNAQTLPLLLEQEYEQRFSEWQPERLEAINFDFRQAISGSGWHHRNGKYNGLKPQSFTFRWTGAATESTIDFPLSTEADLSIQFRIVDAVSPEVLASLKLWVNDRSIALQKITQNSNIIFQGKISQADLQSEKPFTRLKFTVDRTMPLCEAKPASTDTRCVGLAIDRIQIQPATRSPQDPNYLYLLFPIESFHWQAVDRFLSTHVQPKETIVAPTELYEKYPQQIRFYEAVDRSLRPQWFVLHKGRVQSIDPAFLQRAIQSLHAVFADEVFVILTNRSSLPALTESPHLPAFLQAPDRSLSDKIWQKIKGIL